MPSQSPKTWAVCWPGSGAGLTGAGAPSKRTGKAGIRKVPAGCRVDQVGLHDCFEQAPQCWLPGFSSEIFLMPKRQLALVVMVNSRSPATGHTSPLAFRPAETLAANLAYNLFYALPVKGTQ